MEEVKKEVFTSLARKVIVKKRCGVILYFKIFNIQR